MINHSAKIKKESNFKYIHGILYNAQAQASLPFEPNSSQAENSLVHSPFEGFLVIPYKYLR